MSGASLAVQNALVATLQGDAVLTAAVSGIYDAVPVDAALPYVTLGGDIASDSTAIRGSAEVGSATSTTASTMVR